MQRTQSQNSRFYTLLNQRKFDREDKVELVKLCTNGRTTSSKEMTATEMASAIKILDDDQTKSIKKMRAKIINIARDIFGLAPADEWQQSHYDRLNVFLIKKYKAELAKLTYEQLRNAVTSLDAWRTTETKNMVQTLLNGI